MANSTTFPKDDISMSTSCVTDLDEVELGTVASDKSTVVASVKNIHGSTETKRICRGFWPKCCCGFSVCVLVTLITLLSMVFLARPIICIFPGIQVNLLDVLPGALIALSPDGSTMAISEWSSQDGNKSGFVQIYRLMNGDDHFNASTTEPKSWEPIGQPLAIDHDSISPLKLSDGGDVLALVTSSGEVQVLQYDDQVRLWTQQWSATSNGLIANNTLIGQETFVAPKAVALSADATTLVMVTDSSDPVEQGIIEIYNYDGTDWSRSELDSEYMTSEDWITSIAAFDLSTDGSTLAVAGRGTIRDAALRVFKRDSSDNADASWLQVGTESILSSALPTSPSTDDDLDVVALALSSDGNLLAVSSQNSVEVVITLDNGLSWEILGHPLDLNVNGTSLVENSFDSAIVSVSSLSVTDSVSGFVMAIGGRTSSALNGTNVNAEESVGIAEFYHYQKYSERWEKDVQGNQLAAYTDGTESQNFGSSPQIGLSVSFDSWPNAILLVVGPSAHSEIAEKQDETGEILVFTIENMWF